MGAAFLLDHTTPTSDFVDADLATSVASTKQIGARLKFVSITAEIQQLGAEADAFLPQEGEVVISKRTKEAGVCPMAWWTVKTKNTADKDDYYPLLAPLPAMLYTIPTSSAASERSWSIHDFIHTKRRNRLDSQRVEKLVFIYCNAGSKDAKASIFYRATEESESDNEDHSKEEGDEAENEERRR